jgi:hypothetical protein
MITGQDKRIEMNKEENLPRTTRTTQTLASISYAESTRTRKEEEN